MPRKRLTPDQRADQKLTENQLFTALGLRDAEMSVSRIAFIMGIAQSRIKKAFRQIDADIEKERK